MDHICTHVPHLDLVDIGQIVSATVRLMVSCNPIKKDSNCLTLRPQNLKILENVSCFCPSKNFFILTLHTHRQSLGWPLISILTSQPIHETYRGPRKTTYMFSIYMKTVNRKTSLKVSFGSYRGLLQILIDIGPMSSTLHAINRQFVLTQKWPITQTAITRTAVNIEFFKIFAKPSQIYWHLHAPHFLICQKFSKIGT